jgi:hypothetical protein
MTLIFSVVMLMFMAFPAMKIVEWISHKRALSNRVKNFLTIFLTLLLSVLIGVFLEFS